MSNKKAISYLPTDGLTYDPSENLYWDEQALEKEVERVFEVCHGCRMCFKYCDSFPRLFDFIDARDGDVRQLDETHTASVMDACFQCKLCEVQCPYTPRENHEFQLDFPKLVHRYKAVEHRKNGGTLREHVLSNPDAAGKAARATFGLVNKMNRAKAHRWMMEKALGIHRDKQLPDFAVRSFEAWAQEQGLCRVAHEDDVEVVLFQTCYVQNNEPQIGRDTVEVLQKNQVGVACAKGLNCCGMPAWEQGNLDLVREMAHASLEILMPFVNRGAKVLAINPTCSMMMRTEWPELLTGIDKGRAEKLSKAVMDPSEYLWSIRKEERFSRDFKSRPGEAVSYHAPCHLRAQMVGFKGRDLLRLIPGVTPQLTMECCGHDGTYAMTVEGFEPSQRIGKKAFDGMAQGDAEVWATDCPLAALQFEQHAGVKPMHPMSILAKAYRENGFEHPVATEEESDEKTGS